MYPVRDAYHAYVGAKPENVGEIMRKTFFVLFVLFVLLQGCSAMIGYQREKKREAMSTKLGVGTSRSELIKIIGEPTETAGKSIEMFSVCFPKNSNPEYNLLMDIAFLGFWEIWAVPYELATPCDYIREIVVVYDENDRVSTWFNRKNYEDLKSVYGVISHKVDALYGDDELICIDYDRERGWFYIKKASIQCSLPENYTEVDTINILSLHKACDIGIQID